MSNTDTFEADRAECSGPSQTAWFCLRSQPRHEHIAARQLAQMEDVEVFNPRIKFARPTRYGIVWVTESLFPNYLFARFDWNHNLNMVNYAPGVSSIVHFGTRWPTIPDSCIAELKACLGPEDIHVLEDLAPGDTVRIAGGTFHNLQAVITQVMPGRQRVTVLMDFLGRQTMVEVDIGSVAKRGFGR